MIRARGFQNKTVICTYSFQKQVEIFSFVQFREQKTTVHSVSTLVCVHFKITMIEEGQCREEREGYKYNGRLVVGLVESKEGNT